MVSLLLSVTLTPENCLSTFQPSIKSFRTLGSLLNQSCVSLYKDVVQLVIWSNQKSTVKKPRFFKSVCLLKELLRLVTSFLMLQSS